MVWPFLATLVVSYYGDIGILSLPLSIFDLSFIYISMAEVDVMMLPSECFNRYIEFLKQLYSIPILHHLQIVILSF